MITQTAIKRQTEETTNLKIHLRKQMIPERNTIGEKLGNQITKKSHRKKCPEGQKNQDPGRDPGLDQDRDRTIKGDIQIGVAAEAMTASILTKVIRVIQATAAIPIATQITVGVEAEVEVELGVTLLDPKIKILSNRKMLL
jgi:hypothetical protein